MKNIKIFILLALLLVTYSCDSDDLKQFPDYGIGFEEGVNPITDESTMQKTLVGMYQQMSQYDAFGSYVLNIGNLASDDFFVSSVNSGYFVVSNNMSWLPSSAEPGYEYRRLYGVVSQANFVINSTIPQNAKIDSYRGEAYIGRGMAFLFLAMGWAENPTSGKNQEFGIAIPTGEFFVNEKNSRSTVEETYEQIISDLEKGIELVNETPSSKAYLSKTAGYLLLARTYLWKGEYDKAISYSNMAIDNASSSFSLLKKDEIEDYFYGETKLLSDNQPETVFEMGYTVNGNPGVNYSMGVFYDYLDPTNLTTNETGLNVRRSILLRKSIYDLYSDSDQRKKLFLEDTRNYDSPNGYFLKKYRKSIKVESGYENNIANVKILRLTEALFIKWEAMAKSGQGSAALLEVNDFTKERGGEVYSGDALTAVLAEKQKEFIGEGHRFYDLKRNNLSIEKSTNCSSNCLIKTGNKLFVFPIPSYSLNNNSQIIQYPEWGN